MIFLKERKHFIYTLLNNPALLEHELLTDLLLNLLHILKEITNREEINNLIELDIIHLTKEFEKNYLNIIIEWLIYLNHLNKHYYHLFLLEIKNNPFKVLKRN
ncbi:MAG: hypothetical protein ACTSRI_11850 [Promethearchaeota archaeon]